MGVDAAAGWKGFKGEVRARMAVWVGNAGVALKICHSHGCGQRRGCGLSRVLCGDHREPLWGMSVLCVGDTGPSLNQKRARTPWEMGQQGCSQLLTPSPGSVPQGVLRDPLPEAALEPREVPH